ncbi:ATP-binding protein [Vibrio vulnificus]|uniref:ATP-binding protein n=1 Tax=Vibrio vulnificus TaxID=672 RepID=UPI003ED94D75
MEQKIFPIELVLDSMTDSGYKDAAHAVAELIDNSIQARDGDDIVNVELLCIEEITHNTDRSTSKIDKIAVFDNGCGMSPETLKSALAFGQGSRKGAKKGIGKFGMGLPNASISQCNHVEVYSWQNNEIYKSHLDLDELISSGKDTLSPPTQVENLPDEWLGKISTPIKDSGTLVVWSNLERLKWKRHKTFFTNTEFIVGRMYRYFINDKTCRIRMAAFRGGELVSETYVLPNDPLYLMKGTCAPEPFNSGESFVAIPEDGETFTVTYGGEEHEIKVLFSHVLPDFRKNFKEYYPNSSQAGDTCAGRHCAKNMGISVVRANRELELNTDFNIAYNTLERWWGAEIHFEPALDKVFGVTNNKQAATAFKEILKSDVAQEEQISKGDVEDFLAEDDPAKLILLRISELISSRLRTIRKALNNQQEGTRTKRTEDDRLIPEIPGPNDDEIGRSDSADKDKSEEEKAKELQEEIEKDNPGLTEEEKRKLLKEALESDDKFIIVDAPIRGSDLLYDVTNPAGKIKLTINSEHPFYKEYISKLENNSESKEILDAIKLVFAAWALMEDRTQDDNLHEELLEIRKNWGAKAKYMIKSYKSRVESTGK